MKIVKILWIDDMDEWKNIVQENLSLLGDKYKVNFKFVNMRNGDDEDLIQKCQSIDFDLILMDYHMSPNNGDHYIKVIRSEDSLTIVPIIFYSQDNTTDLANKVKDIINVTTIFRPHLEQTVIDKYNLFAP